MRNWHEPFFIPCGDNRSDSVTTGTNVGSRVLPWPFTLLDVQAELVGPATSGTITVDVKANGASVLLVKLFIEAGEITSQTSTTQPAFVSQTPSTSVGRWVPLARGTAITIDVLDDASGDATGLTVYLGGIRHIDGAQTTPTTPNLVQVTINQASGQSDPATGDVEFDVVFSENVTGFEDADVALSGSALATTAVVTGSGDTFLVTVSGMTVEGTVIASIPAGVATSSTTGITNAASTSTDNIVEWEPFTPPAISGCWAWYDAADLSTLTTTTVGPDEVAQQWDDKSGNARHLTGGSYTEARLLNGLNVLDFRGGHNMAVSPVSLGMTAYTVFVVCAGDADHSDSRRIIAFAAGTNRDWDNVNGMSLSDGDTSMRILHYSNNAGLSLAGVGATPADIYTVRKSGTGSNQTTIWRGEGAASATGTHTANGTATNLQVGRATDLATLFFDGIIAEIVIYDNALSDADRNAVWAYLASKWGL